MDTFAYLRVSTGHRALDNHLRGMLECANRHRLGPASQSRARCPALLALRPSDPGGARQTSVKRALSVHVAKRRMVLRGSMRLRITVTILGAAAEIEYHFIPQDGSGASSRRKAGARLLSRSKGRKPTSLSVDAIAVRGDAFRRFNLEVEAPHESSVELMARKSGFRTHEQYATLGNRHLDLVMKEEQR